MNVSAVRYGFFGGAALAFVASAAATIYGCVSMATMPGMPMPGGWTMSMAWMRMPGQGWLDAAASFLGMWIAMMVAMMLPVAAPLLWRHRVFFEGRSWLLAPMTLGYFFVWVLWGLAIYPAGVLLAQLAMQNSTLAQAAPMLFAATAMLAGALQFTGWKSRRLAYCRCVSDRPMTTCIAALRRGLELGMHCSYCCVPPTAILLVVGVMDWRAMLVVTSAIVAERSAPAGGHIARAGGAAAIVWGASLLLT